MRAFLISVMLLAGAVAGPSSPALAEYPERPVTLVVPFPPGGPTDVTARVLAEKMSAKLGHNMIVENKPGASGNIAAQGVARATPDGYTLFFSTGGTHGANPALYPKLGYDPVADFEPVAWVTTSPNIIVVNPSFPAKTLKELIDLAKANPGKYDAAAPGYGSTPHMAGELFKQAAAIDIQHIAYRGSGPALNDLIAGHVSIMFDGIPSSIAQVRAGNLRALAVTGAERLPSAADIPTVAETIPGFEASGWFAVFAPARTPKPVVAKLNALINEVLADPEVRDRYAALGSVAVGGTPEKLAAQVRSELAKWAEVVRVAGIKVE